MDAPRKLCVGQWFKRLPSDFPVPFEVWETFVVPLGVEGVVARREEECPGERRDGLVGVARPERGGGGGAVRRELLRLERGEGGRARHPAQAGFFC